MILAFFSLYYVKKKKSNGILPPNLLLHFTALGTLRNTTPTARLICYIRIADQTRNKSVISQETPPLLVPGGQ